MTSPYPSELRRSTLSNRWVIVAAGRAKRPIDWRPPDSAHKRDPFDPANIKPAEVIARYPEEGDWQVLVLENTFAMLTPGDSPNLRGNQRDGYGKHELVIHSPQVDKDLDVLPVEHVDTVLEAYIQRYRELSKMPHIKYVQIFTNRGEAAGASLAHPHTQILALPVIPGYIGELVRASGEHHVAHGGFVVDDERDRASARTDRLVLENEHFLAHCPFAPLDDYHVCVIPKQPHHTFEAMDAAQRRSLAEIWTGVLQRLNAVVGSVPYNAFIRTAPVGDAPEGFCWHVDFVSRVNMIGGLQVSAELFVITVPPETAAQKLRDAVT